MRKKRRQRPTSRCFPRHHLNVQEGIDASIHLGSSLTSDLGSFWCQWSHSEVSLWVTLSKIVDESVHIRLDDEKSMVFEQAYCWLLLDELGSAAQKYL